MKISSRLGLLLVANLALASAAHAQISGPTPGLTGSTNTGPGIPHMGLMCVDNHGNDQVCFPSGVGFDASGAAPSIGSVLATFTVSQPGEYFVQNQCATAIQVVFDDGSATAGTVSVQLLAPGAAAGQQGADTTPPMPWFTGRIRVAGASGCQFMARHN